MFVRLDGVQLAVCWRALDFVEDFDNFFVLVFHTLHENSEFTIGLPKRSISNLAESVNELESKLVNPPVKFGFHIEQDPSDLELPVSH